MIQKNILAVALLSVSLLIFGTPATADKHSKQKINPWQHCGIGAGIFNENGTAAAISNIIWDSGTTAVTSATASPETCSSKELETARFIDETYDVLVMQTAMGEGKHLAAAMDLAGCHSTARQEVTAKLRHDLQALTTQANYRDLDHSQKAYSYYSSLLRAASSAEDCLNS